MASEYKAAADESLDIEMADKAKGSDSDEIDAELDALESQCDSDEDAQTDPETERDINFKPSALISQTDDTIEEELPQAGLDMIDAVTLAFK